MIAGPCRPEQIHFPGGSVSRCAGGFLLMSSLDRRARDPLHRQIVERIVAAIDRGEVAAGERLPSTRALGRSLRVSRNTVITAYDELVAHGVIEARRGDGARISPGAVGPRAAAARALRDAGGPVRLVHIADPDGTSIAISF
jgi:GntR family transcriptional regulator/MocR family aminotransferase